MDNPRPSGYSKGIPGDMPKGSLLGLAERWTWLGFILTRVLLYSSIFSEYAKHYDSWASTTSFPPCTQLGIRSFPSPGRRFLSATQKETEKITAQGTGLPCLALRHRRGNLVRLHALRQCLTLHLTQCQAHGPNPLVGSFEYHFLRHS